MLGCLSYRWTRPHVTYTGYALFCAVSASCHQERMLIFLIALSWGGVSPSYRLCMYHFPSIYFLSLISKLSFELPLDHNTFNGWYATKLKLPEIIIMIILTHNSKLFWWSSRWKSRLIVLNSSCIPHTHTHLYIYIYIYIYYIYIYIYIYMHSIYKYESWIPH